MTRTSIPAAAVPPSVVILGSDALLTALPATPTQLANACYAAGYEGVFPASWGDELVAAGCLKNLETRVGPAILCACPLVSEQLRGVAPLQRFQLHLISPPVAAARYLRALCDDAPLRITYVGDCPGAENEAIDERVSPAEFLRRLSERGITPRVAAPGPRRERAARPAPILLAARRRAHARMAVGRLAQADPRGQRRGRRARRSRAPCARAREHADRFRAAARLRVQRLRGRASRRTRRASAVAALEPQRARQEVLDPDLRIAVEALVPMGTGGEEVTWDDFLASLPGSARAGWRAGRCRGASGRRPRRRRSGARARGACVPRAYATPRVTRRRTGAPDIAGRRRARAHRPEEAAPPAAAPVAGAGTAHLDGRTGRAARSPYRAARNWWKGRAGRGTHCAARPALTPADRWLLIAIVLVASVLSASIASYLTVRALAGRPAPVSAPGRSRSTPAARPAETAAGRQRTARRR